MNKGEAGFSEAHEPEWQPLAQVDALPLLILLSLILVFYLTWKKVSFGKVISRAVSIDLKTKISLNLPTILAKQRGLKYIILNKYTTLLASFFSLTKKDRSFTTL